MGIEPTSSAWKAEVLPLNYTRIPIILTPSKADLESGGGGRIRTYEGCPTDLQSAPFDRFGTPPQPSGALCI